MRVQNRRFQKKNSLTGKSSKSTQILKKVLRNLKMHFPDIKIVHKEARLGDVKDSQNQPDLLKSFFPKITPIEFRDGLVETIDWLIANSKIITSNPVAQN